IELHSQVVGLALGKLPVKLPKNRYSTRPGSCRTSRSTGQRARPQVFHAVQAVVHAPGHVGKYQLFHGQDVLDRGGSGGEVVRQLDCRGVATGLSPTRSHTRIAGSLQDPEALGDRKSLFPSPVRWYYAPSEWRTAL